MRETRLSRTTIAWSIVVLGFLPGAVARGQDALPAPRKLQPPADVHALALSGDGKTLITLDQGKTARLWNVAQGTHEVLYQGASRLESLALHPGGKLVAVQEGYVGDHHVFDVTIKKKVGTLAGTSAVFSADGKWLGMCRGSEADIYDAETLKSVHRFYAYQIKIDFLAFRPSLKAGDDANLTVATLGKDALKGQLWNVTARKRDTFFYSRNKELLGKHVDFRSDGKVLACSRDAKDGNRDGNKEGDILLWDFSGDLPVADLPAEGAVLALAFRPNSNHLAVARSMTPLRGGVELWDVGTQKKIAQTDVAAVKGLAMSADGNTIAVSSAGPKNRSIIVWDLSRLPAPPLGPLAKNPAGSLPETKDSYRAYLEDLLELAKGEDLPEFVLEPLAKVGVYDRPLITMGGKPYGDAKQLMQFTATKHLSPWNTDMRLVKNGKTADLKEVRRGDLVEVSYSSRRFPSTEVTVIEHDAARTRRQEGFVAAMKLLAPPPPTRFGKLLRKVERFESELSTLTRRVVQADRLDAEDNAAATIFKLIEEAPTDRQSFNFLSELLAMNSPPVYTKAAEWMVKHQVKYEQIKAFLYVPRIRAKAPDELFVRLLEQKEVPEHRADACMVLANRAYYRAKQGQDKASKQVGNKDAVAAAIKYHEWLKKEFAKETMTDMQRLVTAFPPRKPAGVMADERLAEMRGVWVGLPKIVLAGEPAPELEGVDLDGNKIKLSDFKGKVVLLHILSYSPPRSGVPKNPIGEKKSKTPPPGPFDLEKSMIEKFRDKPFVCVLVRWDPSGAATRDLLKKENIDWPVIRMRGYSGDYSRQMLKDWPSRTSGRMFIIDARGNVRLRGYTFPREIGETLEGLFNEKN